MPLNSPRTGTASRRRNAERTAMRSGIIFPRFGPRSPRVFISPAYAQLPTPTGDTGILNIGMLVLMLVVFWFILIRPQMKRAKEHKAMLETLEKGSEVVTAGGIVGKISKISDAYITLEIANNTEITVQKQSVQTLLPKGTMKSL